MAQAAEYLTSRGVTGVVAQRYRLGYVASPVIGDEDYVGRLSIPYITPTGVVDINFRSLNGKGPKYMRRPGSGSRPYNVVALHEDSDMIVICEGEFDTITMHGLCGVPAVGIPGANAWKDHYRIMFEDYRRVFVVCDGDQPGRDFGKHVVRELNNAVAIHLPDGADVNSFYLDNGADSVKERLGL